MALERNVRDSLTCTISELLRCCSRCYSDSNRSFLRPSGIFSSSICRFSYPHSVLDPLGTSRECSSDLHTPFLRNAARPIATTEALAQCPRKEILFLVNLFVRSFVAIRFGRNPSVAIIGFVQVRPAGRIQVESSPIRPASICQLIAELTRTRLVGWLEK